MAVAPSTLEFPSEGPSSRDGIVWLHVDCSAKSTTVALGVVVIVGHVVILGGVEFLDGSMVLRGGRLSPTYKRVSMTTMNNPAAEAEIVMANFTLYSSLLTPASVPADSLSMFVSGPVLIVEL